MGLRNIFWDCAIFSAIAQYLHFFQIVSYVKCISSLENTFEISYIATYCGLYYCFGLYYYYNCTTTALLLHYYYYYYGTTVRLIKVCGKKPCTASRDQQLYDNCCCSMSIVQVKRYGWADAFSRSKILWCTPVWECEQLLTMPLGLL